MKKLIITILILFVLSMPFVIAKVYDVNAEVPLDTSLPFDDLMEPIMEENGRRQKTNDQRVPLYKYNPFLNEILKAMKITIDKDGTKLIAGYPDEPNKFKPDANITKAEFIKMAIGLSVDRNFDFSIISSGHINHWAAPYVAVAEMQNVVNKGDYNAENLNEPITRLEMITILSKIQINMKGIPQYREGVLPNYTDIDNLSEEEKGYLLHAAKYELIEGMLNSDFKEIKPFSYLTRAEAARAIVRVY